MARLYVRLTTSFSWEFRACRGYCLAWGEGGAMRASSQCSFHDCSRNSIQSSPLLFDLFLRELIAIEFFQAIKFGAEAFRIDEAVGIVGVAGLVLVVHFELGGVRGEIHVDLHFLHVVK